MNPVRARFVEDLALVEECLAGRESAWASLRERLHSILRSALIRRGASESEADDLLADFWADTILKSGQRGILERFDGSYSLKNWFASIVTHRFVDLKRRQRFQADLPAATPELPPNDFDRLPCTGAAPQESALLGLMQQALKHALQQVDVEERVLLRLVYLEGLTQREIAAVWSIDETKLSRLLRRAMETIATETTAYVRRRDPYLQLTWQDLIELCESSVDALWVDT
jgi:RNA polymerase sigma factor (sigma-70 family)